jgi:small subunit ribosomal protein S18
MGRGGGGDRDRDRDRKRGPKDNGKRGGKKKICIFCKDHIEWVDYKDVNLLRRFMSDRGKIRARRVSGNCSQHQRDVAVAIKTARELALLPYVQRAAAERSSGRGRPGRDVFVPPVSRSGSSDDESSLAAIEDDITVAGIAVDDLNVDDVPVGGVSVDSAGAGAAGDDDAEVEVDVALEPAGAPETAEPADVSP